MDRKRVLRRGPDDWETHDDENANDDEDNQPEDHELVPLAVGASLTSFLLWLL